MTAFTFNDDTHDWPDYVEFPELLGKTFRSVTADDDTVVFDLADGTGKYVLEHRQDCCESVYIESIVGDLQDLVGSEILLSEEATSQDLDKYGTPSDSYVQSATWTFYKWAPRKGYVDIRFFGESNGYYSGDVDLRFYRAKTPH